MIRKDKQFIVYIVLVIISTAVGLVNKAMNDSTHENIMAIILAVVLFLAWMNAITSKEEK